MLKTPPTANPSSNGRKAPAKGDPGPETEADVEGAMRSNPGPGSGRAGNPWANLGGGGGAAALKKDIG